MGDQMVRRLTYASTVLVAATLIYAFSSARSVQSIQWLLVAIGAIPVLVSLSAYFIGSNGRTGEEPRMIQVGATTYLGDPLTVALGLRKKQMRKEAFELLEQGLREEPERMDLIREQIDLCNFLPNPARHAELTKRLAELEAKMPPR